MTIDTIENLIDNQPKSYETTNISKTDNKFRISNFLNDFLEKFFETIDDENTEFEFI